ncbi:ATP-binding protein [Halopenitus sp. H-Gu1]|uniref:ATP-binding protein n=1 Tax=Halopenitus sp. H-Gu1 TaxID=3242697 RepID=UPI00359EE826
MPLQSSLSGQAVLAVYVLTFGAAALTCFLTIPRARRFDDADTRRGLIGLLVLSGGWASAHVGFLLAPSGPIAIAFYVAGLVSGFSTIGAWLYFCSAYTGRTLHRQALYRRFAVGLYLAVILVKFTNPIHGLYFTTEFVTQPFVHLSVQHLIGHWLAMGLAYALAAVGIFMLFEQFTQVGADTRPLAVLVGFTALPLALDLLGYMLPFVLDMTYEPLGVAVFAVGVTSIFFDRFQATRIATESDDPVIILDNEDRITDYNVSARRLFPLLSGPSIIGREIDEVLPEVADAIDSEENVRPIDIDGETRYFHVSIGPFTVGSRHLGRLVTITDVTDHERYRMELERQNERLEQFASVVSHDLRNPLNVVQGRIDLAMDSEAGDVELIEHLEAADRALDRMEELISDVLTLARQGQPIDETEPVRLSSICEAAWSMIDAGEATLSVDGDVVLLADPERLQQLFENLLRNSIEHAGPEVNITVGPLDDSPSGPVGFYFEDDGPGIPEADRSTVFEYGYSTAREGTGLGLAIVSEIAEAHDWDVVVTDADTGGARFEITGGEPVDADAVDAEVADVGSVDAD